MDSVLLFLPFSTVLSFTLSEDTVKILNSAFILGNVQRGGAGVQPESKSNEVFLLFPILTTFRTLNGGSGEGARG